MATIKKNSIVKPFSRNLSKSNRREWCMAFNTNPDRGEVFDQTYFLNQFDRDYGDGYGASKTVHLLENIVVKRHQTGGYCPDIAWEHRNGNKVEKLTGNQLIDEINCYLEFNDTEYADLLCPIFKYFTSKSDKVSATSETMQRNVVIIAQRAIKTGDAETCCRYARELNREHGYHGEGAYSRLADMQAMSDRMGWRDAMKNRGNSGVIFDYSKNCYKAVFIDYAL